MIRQQGNTSPVCKDIIAFTGFIVLGFFWGSFEGADSPYGLKVTHTGDRSPHAGEVTVPCIGIALSFLLLLFHNY